MNKIQTTLLTASIFFALTSSAFAGGFASISGVSDFSHTGGEIELGHRFSSGGFGLSVSPIAGTYYEKDHDPRYRQESASICRDTTNGQFSNKENCQTKSAFKYAPSISTDYTFGNSFSVGVGIRKSWDTATFAQLKFRAKENSWVTIRASKDYYTFGVQFGY